MRRLLLLTAAVVMLGGTDAAWANQDTAESHRQSQAAPQTPGQSGDMTTLQTLLGRTVTGSDGRALGQVSDIVLDEGGEQANVAVINTGAADGAGEKLIAIDYTLLDISGDTITARTVTRDQVTAMPTFEYGDSMISLGNKGGAKRAQ